MSAIYYIGTTLYNILFNGRQVALKLPDLRMYSDGVQSVAARV